jgi:hypothetical protein
VKKGMLSMQRDNDRIITVGDKVIIGGADPGKLWYVFNGTYLISFNINQSSDMIEMSSFGRRYPERIPGTSRTTLDISIGCDSGEMREGDINSLISTNLKSGENFIKKIVQETILTRALDF